jgi:hypothetical protein
LGPGRGHRDPECLFVMADGERLGLAIGPMKST